MPPTRRFTFLIVASSLLLGGCAEKTPPLSQASESTSQEISKKAPQVQNPLNASSLLTAPCRSLSASQASSFSMEPQGKDSSVPISPACEWRDKELTSSVAISFLTANPKGLQDLYDIKDADPEVRLERLEDIQGHPAIIYTLIPEKLNAGECAVLVAANDNLVYSAHYTTRDPSKFTTPCEPAKKFADAVLTNLKKGQP